MYVFWIIHRDVVFAMSSKNRMNYFTFYSKQYTDGQPHITNVMRIHSDVHCIKSTVCISALINSFCVYFQTNAVCLIYMLPSLATPWRVPDKIDLYDVRRRPWWAWQMSCMADCRMLCIEGGLSHTDSLQEVEERGFILSALASLLWGKQMQPKPTIWKWKPLMQLPFVQFLK